MKMKQIDRLSLIDKIGRELQSRMGYGDIDTYLKGFGVSHKGTTKSYGSKWVYTKDLLSDVAIETIVRIADELDIPHSYTVSPAREIVESRFWEPNRFKLFLCHLSSFKGKTRSLQASLSRFAITAFVAHVDIQPTKEWQEEIEAALYSMDALAAILVPGFKASDWTDQEIGIAIGRGILVVPIMRGGTPYGFIAKYQGLSAVGKTVQEVARELFLILVSSPKTRSRMLTCLTDTILRGAAESEAMSMLTIFDSISDLPNSYVERLREGALRSQVFGESTALLTKLNDILAKRRLATVSLATGVEPDVISDEDIPF
jgi:TIR domain